MDVKLYALGRLLAAGIGILPLFFFKSRKKQEQMRKKRGKKPIFAAKSRPCECSLSGTGTHSRVLFSSPLPSFEAGNVSDYVKMHFDNFFTEHDPVVP